jgi:hypothetical protein
VRENGQELSLTLLLGIAMIYALRDLLRDDMIDGVTELLRKGKPRWKIRLLTPYMNQLLALQKIWLDYRKLLELPQTVLERSGKWATNEERQIICYRSELNMGRVVLEQHQVEERLTLDCEELCEMIQAAGDKLFVWADPDDPSSSVQAHTIEKQHDYNLLLVLSEPDQGYSSAQRWHLRLGSHGIVKCKTKQAHWPSPEEQRNKTLLQRLRDQLRRR